jgi:hypothetical protein
MVTRSADEPGRWSAERVRRHIGDPERIRWVELSSTIRRVYLSCIDGRDPRAVVGTPGGDAGEFLLALAAAERLSGSPFHDAAVERLLLVRFDVLGDFYLHSDGEAFDALVGALRADSDLAGAGAHLAGRGERAERLRGLPEPLRERVLDRMLRPESIGCGHLRSMLEHAEDYGTRAELVRSFLRAFFRHWWRGAPGAHFSVLAGRHEERAVVNVRSADDTRATSRVPLISGSRAGRQIFVNHPEVATFLRRRMARTLTRDSGASAVAPEREEELLAAIDDLAGRQLAATVGRLAPDLPVFDALFSADGSFEVRAVSVE